MKRPSSIELEVSKIAVTGLNPRKAFDEDKMKELTESIRVSGILQALLVRPKDDEYELVIGERRLRAAKEIGLETVPAVVRDMTDEQVLVAMLSENLQREDLNPIEEAETIKRILEMTELTARELAKQLSKSEVWVSKRLQLLEIPDDLRQFLLEGKVSPHHIEILTQWSGYAIYTEILRRMKDELKQRDMISIRTLQALVDGTIMSDFRAERSLNLIEFPHEYKDRHHYFDVKECLECGKPGHVTYESEDPALTDFCIDRPCYSDKLNRAKHAVEEASVLNIGKLSPAKVGEYPDEIPKSEIKLHPLQARQQVLTVEIVEPNTDACDGCPAWDLKHQGCLEGHGNATNCPQHNGGREAVKKIRAEEADIEETSGDIAEKVPLLKTQKCHVLDCTNETEPGSHWCKDHGTPESRRKIEEPVGEEEKGDPEDRRVITRRQYALVRRASFLGPNDEKEPRFEELERAGRPAKDIVHRYKTMPRSNTAKRDLLKWCYPPLEEVDL